MAISNNSTGIRPGVCTSTTRPTAPYVGQLIFETDTFVLKYWTGSAWQGAVSAPAGTMDLYAGSTAPTGWLLAYGQAVSRSTYADLFAVLSTTYGAGDGSTTFALPDMRGRVPAGLDNMGGSAASRLTSTVLTASNTLGATGGTQTHTLTEAQMPSHSHTQAQGGSLSTVANVAGGYIVGNQNTSTTQSTGSGAAHLNTQPTIVLNYIIKF
jgi:microcystin-dependent protein